MGFELFETPDGHVSIRPPTQQALENWAAARPEIVKGNTTHILTQMVKSAIVEQVETPKIK